MLKINSLITSTLLVSLLSFSAIAAEHKVEMKNNGEDGMMVFEPGYLKVDPGDTVEFVSVDPTHNSTSVHVPKGAEKWTGEISKSITVTLDQEGVYVYKCTPHALMGMVGVIQVGNATNLKKAQKAAKKLARKMATNKDRLENYMAQVQ